MQQMPTSNSEVKTPTIPHPTGESQYVQDNKETVSDGMGQRLEASAKHSGHCPNVGDRSIQAEASRKLQTLKRTKYSRTKCEQETAKAPDIQAVRKKQAQHF